MSFMRYPPRGVRGVARAVRAANFGYGFEAYFKTAHETLLCVVQIETKAVGAGPTVLDV